MKIINHACEEISQKFQADWKNLKHQGKTARQLNLRDDNLNLKGLARVTLAATRLALLVSSVAMTIFATIQVPVMIAGGSMSPFVGLIILSAGLYVAHHKLVEHDPFDSINAPKSFFNNIVSWLKNEIQS